MAVRTPWGHAPLARISLRVEAVAERWRRPVAWFCAVNLLLAVSGATMLLRPAGTGPFTASAIGTSEAQNSIFDPSSAGGATGQLTSVRSATATHRSAGTRPGVPSAAAAPAGGSTADPVAAGPPAPGSDQAGQAGATAAALAMASSVGGIPLRAGDLSATLNQPVLTRPGTCPFNQLQVLWSAPAGNYDIGGYIAPLGPPPTAGTTDVNGVIVCQGSTYEYLGFEARWDGQHWSAVPVPSSADDGTVRLPSDDTVPAPVPSQPIVSPSAPSGPSSTVAGAWGPTIEDLAAYVPQAECDPTPKPGVVGLRALLLKSFPGSRDLGIGQSCDAPDGVSEHKEGRAFDWGVRASNPTENAMADQFLAWLFAPDQYGNQYAMIRRLGIMYLIWNDHIWGSYAADQGWRPYGGPNPHTDHIHISFSWAGALAQTSFWSGRVVNVGLVTAPPGAIPPPAPAGQPAGTLAAGPVGPASPSAPPASPSSPTAAPGSPGTAGGPAPGPAPAPAPSGTTPTTSGGTTGSGGTSGGSTGSGGSTPPSTTTTTTAPPPAPPPVTVPPVTVPAFP